MMDICSNSVCRCARTWLQPGPNSVYLLDLDLNLITDRHLPPFGLFRESEFSNFHFFETKTSFEFIVNPRQV